MNCHQSCWKKNLKKKTEIRKKSLEEFLQDFMTFKFYFYSLINLRNELIYLWESFCLTLSNPSETPWKLLKPPKTLWIPLKRTWDLCTTYALKSSWNTLDTPWKPLETSLGSIEFGETPWILLWSLKRAWDPLPNFLQRPDMPMTIYENHWNFIKDPLRPPESR